MEISVKGNTMSADCQAKIRRVCLTADFNSSQRTAVLAGGPKNSTDAGQGSQIGLSERISSFDGCVAGTGFIKRSEMTGGMNVADRPGIDQRGIELQRLIGANVFHPQIADIEFQREFAGPGCVDDQLRILANEGFNKDAHFFAPSHAAYFLTVASRRYVHDQTAYVYLVHTHGLAKQIPQWSLKAKFADLEQWLNSRLMGIGIGSAVDLQARAEDLDSVGHGNMQAGQFYPAFETSRQRFNHSRAQDGLRVRDRESNGNSDVDDQKEEKSDDPTPSPTQEALAALRHKIQLWGEDRMLWGASRHGTHLEQKTEQRAIG